MKDVNRETGKLFAFLVHPGYPASIDTRQIFWIFGLLSDETIGKIFKLRIKFNFLGLKIDWKFPIITKGIYDKKTHALKGWVIGVTVTAKQIVSANSDDRNFVFERIKDAINIAKRLGASYIGLGSLISPFLHGGKDIAESFPGLTITHGNNFTALETYLRAKEVYETLSLDRRNSKIAVFGATGSVGRAVTELLIQDGYSLIIHSRHINELQKLKAEMNEAYPDAEIYPTNNPLDMSQAKVMVVVVSGIGLKVLPTYLGQNSIVIDVTRPKNTTPELASLRPDVLFIDGGTVSVGDIVHSMRMGLPEGEQFACFTETLLMAENCIEGNRVGCATATDARIFGELIQKVPGRRLGSLRSFGKPISLNMVKR